METIIRLLPVHAAFIFIATPVNQESDLSQMESDDFEYFLQL